MQAYFVSYHTTLAKHGLILVLKDNRNLSVAHVLSATKPATLKGRLEADFRSLITVWKRTSRSFLVMKLSETFHLVDAGLRKKSKERSKARDTKFSGSTNHNGNRNITNGTYSNTELPVRLWSPHVQKVYRHLVKDWKHCQPDEKQKLLIDRAFKLAETGPHSFTHSKTIPRHETDP